MRKIKNRPQRKARNLMALAMHNNYKPAAIAPKKGKGSKYDRKRDRKDDLSGPSFLPMVQLFG